ncbi:histone deacetylase family protein [Bordetella pseudohinzii]|uniref:Acetylpolyamine aminohydrolase n=1 Tax=Bordetella pseudohinzii TaxID=1331258 RepID=A0A0J6BUH3_9BORD|nr:histone deacetylase family protein [Bordetella pseudohinzii]ANY16770.1 acetylpolyamine aminohydrolase [Bordetella pseudohinzii]KMM25479.1 acetylpolyamine aminohydrolase [Bordetella pseudohinzii]KXA76264.1 acetylpolyamine aminohydrolase [Bordetella pseudohinzii]KXA76833.1 acetylpolyamine aminohydrolase [Bordetella pseudohinzii]CUI90884.1 Acetylpolyamine aminohydrolase [Bordetella pseudohinzii]
MHVVYADQQQQHQPEHFMVAGRVRPNPDVPARLAGLREGVAAMGYAIHAPEDFGLQYLSRVHTARYLDFLEHAHALWSRLPNAGPEVVPNAHPRRPDAPYPQGIVGRAGFHMYDLACAIGPHTWQAMRWGANSAASAARGVAQGRLDAAYALCRSPGHHAGPEYAGGFCYLNGTAVAAEVLRERYDRVAIIDVDVHHGNGTQDIFYARGDVLTISLHGDTAEFYPFYWGSAGERGQGEGEGANLNIPLARGTADAAYLAQLSAALERASQWGAQALVVALGFDGYERDPLAWLSISTEGFGRIAQALAGLGLPTVLVQEGGYMCEDLAANLRSFMTNFEAAHRVARG